MELELAAVEWAMRKFRLNLLGLSGFSLIVDHQALVSILDRKTLDLVENPKLQRLKERLSPYVFTSTWRKGKNRFIPDALSRAPVGIPTAEDMAVTETGSEHIKAMFIHRISSFSSDKLSSSVTEDAKHRRDPLLAKLREAAGTDSGYAALVMAVSNGFPDRRDRTESAEWQ